VKQFVRGLMPPSAPEPIVRFETKPGHQMHADWATVGRGAARLSVSIATLGWSRAAHVEFCDAAGTHIILPARVSFALPMTRQRGACRRRSGRDARDRCPPASQTAGPRGYRQPSALSLGLLDHWPSRRPKWPTSFVRPGLSAQPRYNRFRPVLVQSMAQLTLALQQNSILIVPELAKTA